MTPPSVVPHEVAHYLDVIDPWATAADIAKWLGLRGSDSVTKALKSHARTDPTCADLLARLKRHEIARKPWGLAGTAYYRRTPA